MGLFKKQDLVDVISKVPGVDMTDEVKARLKSALGNNEIAGDMQVILEAAIDPFQRASENPATDGNLRSAFNSVAKVLPLAVKSIREQNVSKVDALFLTPTFVKLAFNKSLETAFKKPDPAVAAIFDALLGNGRVQESLTRILTKPEGKGLFVLEQGADGQGYGVEQLSGTYLKFPLTKENYATVNSILNAANGNNPQQPPKYGMGA